MASRWSKVPGVEVFLGWVSMMCWFGRYGGQVLSWLCLWLVGMNVSNNMVGLVVDWARQWTRPDLFRDMLQLQLQ